MQLNFSRCRTLTFAVEGRGMSREFQIGDVVAVIKAGPHGGLRKSKIRAQYKNGNFVLEEDTLQFRADGRAVGGTFSNSKIEHWTGEHQARADRVIQVNKCRKLATIILERAERVCEDDIALLKAIAERTDSASGQ